MYPALKPNLPLPELCCPAGVDTIANGNYDSVSSMRVSAAGQLYSSLEQLERRRITAAFY
jgi:hypothetical protein